MSHKIKSQGFALIGVVLILLIVGALIGVGAKMIKPTAKKIKFVDTRGIIQAAVDAVIAYAAANDRLPVYSTFLTLTNPNDAFTRPLIYVFDDNLTTTVCGRSTAAISSGSTSNIAFVVVSGSDNYRVDATLAGNPLTSSGPDAGSFVLNGDIAQWATINELRAKAGCAPSQLTIINNELPSGTETVPYSATVFADGGVTFADVNGDAATEPDYEWCWMNSTDLTDFTFDCDLTGTLARESTTTCSLTAGTWQQCTSLIISGTPGTDPNNAGSPHSLTFYVRDDNDQTGINDNIAQKTLKITIAASPAPPGGEITFDNDLPGFVDTESSGDTGAITVNNEDGTITLGGNEGGATWGCAWYATSKIMKDGSDEFTLRTYFDFIFVDVDTHSDSRNYGYGFTYAVMEGNILTSDCGDQGEDMGFDGIVNAADDIPRKGVAVEFDIYPDVTQKNDPRNRYNHLAIVLDSNNKHETGGNPACDGVNTGCYSQESSVAVPSARWLEDNEPHGARIELDPSGGSDGKAKIEIWICDGSGCDSSFKDLSADYTSTASPIIEHDFTFPSEMNSVKLGFTEGTSGQTQSVVISNFKAGFY